MATDHFQSADKRLKLSGKSRQFATAPNCMQHNQTNIQFQFLLKSDSDIQYDGTSDRAATKRATGDTGCPLGAPFMEKRSIAVFMKQSRDVNTTNPNPKTETKLN